MEGKDQRKRGCSSDDEEATGDEGDISSSTQQEDVLKEEEEEVDEEEARLNQESNTVNASFNKAEKESQEQDGQVLKKLLQDDSDKDQISRIPSSSSSSSSTTSSTSSRTSTSSSSSSSSTEEEEEEEEEEENRFNQESGCAIDTVNAHFKAERECHLLEKVRCKQERERLKKMLEDDGYSEESKKTLKKVNKQLVLYEETLEQVSKKFQDNNNSMNAFYGDYILFSFEVEEENCRISHRSFMRKQKPLREKLNKVKESSENMIKKITVIEAMKRGAEMCCSKPQPRYFRKRRNPPK